MAAKDEYRRVLEMDKSCGSKSRGFTGSKKGRIILRSFIRWQIIVGVLMQFIVVKWTRYIWTRNEIYVQSWKSFIFLFSLSNVISGLWLTSYLFPKFRSVMQPG